MLTEENRRIMVLFLIAAEDKVLFINKSGRGRGRGRFFVRGRGRGRGIIFRL